MMVPRWCAHASDNNVNGVPACASELFQNHVARKTFGFSGYVVSDCDSIGDDAFFRFVNNSLPLQQRVSGKKQTDATKAALGPHAVRRGLVGGCDCNCGSTYDKFMFDAVGGPDTGAVGDTPTRAQASAALHTAVERIMTQAIETGFLDDNKTVSYSTLGAKDIDTPAHQELARSAAEQSIVVLKNDGMLPLSTNASYAVLGPHFNSTVEFQSIYFGENKHVLKQSPLEAFKRRGINVVGAAMGCDYTWCAALCFTTMLFLSFPF